MSNETCNELKEKMFDFAYLMALGDATARVSSKGEKDTLKNNEKMKEDVKEYIDGIFEGKKIDTIDVINQVIKEVNTDSFTFGKAQKLVNMTAKYMYLSCYSDMGKRKLFKNCHCPMDRIMIKRITDRIREQHDGKMTDKYKLPDESKGWSSVSWSKITEKHTKDKTDVDVYNTFQEMARDLADDMGVSPLELDILLW